MRVTLRLTYFIMHFSASCIILQGCFEQIWITIFQYRKSPMQNIGTMQLDNQQSSWQSGRSPGDDGTSSHLTTSDTNDGFFERPVRIFSTQWEIGVTLNQEINPWKLFCEDPRVSNRLAHFKNLKMNLHVQLLVNGNPFYYGRGIMFYNPLPNTDSVSRLTAPPERADLVEQTQRPHIYFDPTKSEGGELVLPFVWPKAALDVPAAEWNAMGIITLKSMNPLTHANGATEPITITLLAYASGVELNTPTSTVPLNLSPQGRDEYGTISFPAHLVAKAAGAVGDAPIIGKFARATEMLFGAISNAASIFGYSRPRAVPDQLALVRQFGEQAVTNFPDTSLSLALDSKKEVTIDPRVVGLAPIDEMSFLSIATREAYVGRFVWSESNATSDHLWSQAITPFAGMVDNDGDFHIAPMAMVALPFEFWKGSMEVRLQVVCSAYHRGRLRIAWDPDYVDDPNTFNVNYSTMLDISESTEITMRIGWGQSYDYLRTGLLANGINASGTAPPFFARPTFANGHLQVFVVNPLTSPSTAITDIEINVFMKACEDFEVASPTTINLSKIKVLENAVRPPDNVIGVQQVFPNSPTAMLSRGSTLPLFTDTRTVSSGVLSKNGFIRGGWLYNYSPNASTFVTTIEFKQNPGGDADIEFNLSGIDYTIPVPPGGAIVTQDFTLQLQPGWTKTPFTVGQDSGSDNQVLKVKTQIPGDAQFIALTPNLLQPLCLPAVNLGLQGGEPTITPVSGGVPIVITLPDFYPDTPANIITLGETVITGATPETAPVTPVSSGHIQTVYPGIDGKITITGNGLWNIRSINYLKKNIDLIPQGQAEELNAESDDANAPESMSPDVTMGPTSAVRGLNDIYFGERAESVRTILKRYETWLTVDTPDGTTPAGTYGFVCDHYPHIPINLTGTGWSMTTRNDLTVFNLFSSAYVCMRGGMRFKLSLARPVNAFERYSVTRYSTEEAIPPSLTIISDAALAPRPTRWRGTATDTCAIKPYAEFELPMYTNLRFTSGRCRRAFLRSEFIEKPTYLVESHLPNANNKLSVNYAAAEDFSLSFYLSTPILRPIP